MKKKLPQVGDLVEMCWDPRYSKLKMGIVVGFQDEYAQVMWKEGDITREWAGNLDPVSNRSRKDMKLYDVTTRSKHETR